ncbi:MAG: histidinol-phosphatase HisJ family protein [Firmicutes bacterium]|nr:histidinol-phosphatase HisJ family protein [Bacillota bacterium]
MIVDYHLHTSRCGHATGTMAEYAAAAEKQGIAEIGFADHFPLELLGFTPQHRVNMPPEELDKYVAEVRRLQSRLSIPVRLGAEVDYLPGREKETAAALARHDFDYCIGSVHFLDGWDFTHPKEVKRYAKLDIDELYEHYFALIRDMAASGLFDIVGHLDVVKKFAHFPRHDWSSVVEATCREIKKADLCVEVNTAGWRAAVKEAYPGVMLLRKCLELGIPVTLGSDAHSPKEVGSGLRRAVLLLARLGFREIATFCSRRRIMRPLFPL